MEILTEHLPLLIAFVVAVTVLAFFAWRTRFTLLLTAVQGIGALFTLCFLMWSGASLEELLLTVFALLLPNMIFAGKKGGNKE